MKLLSPARRREAVCHAQADYRAVTPRGVSERRACRVVGQCRATQQYVPSHTEGELSTKLARIVVSKLSKSQPGKANPPRSLNQRVKDQ